MFEKNPVNIDFETLKENLFDTVLRPDKHYSNFIMQNTVSNTMNDKALSRALEKLETMLIRGRMKMEFVK